MVALFDRQLILAQAFSVLNEMGLEGLTLRRLAARLGVKAPAIYWHFKNKQDLMDEMATQVFREALEEAPVFDATQTWRNWAISYCRGLRRTLLRYREGAKMFSGTYLTDATLYAPMEASLRKLTGAGFTLRHAVVGMGALYSYVVGYVIEEQAVGLAASEGDPRYDLAHRNQRIDQAEYPLAFAAGREMFADHDTRFQEGADLIIQGMAAWLASDASPKANLGVNPDAQRGLTNPS